MTSKEIGFQSLEELLYFLLHTHNCTEAIKPIC